MTVEYVIKDKPNQYTSSDSAVVKLELTASGNYKEIEWYEKQLNKIGEKRNV